MELHSRATLLCCLLLVLGGCLSVPGGMADQPFEDSTGPTSSGTLPFPTPGRSPPPPDGTVVTIIDVVDGDTMDIRYENGTRATIRLLGVDTPEVHVENEPEEFEGVPTTGAGRSCLRKYGHRASAFAKRQLAGEKVTITFDPIEPRRGYYGRLLVYVHDDGREFNQQLLRRGLARVYDSSFTKEELYYAIEAAAMAAGRGLWTCRDPSKIPTGSPTVTPLSETGVVITDLHANAEGIESENLNGEFIVVTNREDAPVDLGGWTLTEDAGRTYTFPEGTILAPGESVTVHSGSGTNGDGHLYWGQEGPILDNGGETVVLRDANGTVVAKRSV